MADYIFIIYSCKKNIDIANYFYDKINSKIHNTKVYIIYGNNIVNTDITCQYEIVDDKYIILNVKDNYDSLCYKTLLLIKTINHIFPYCKGMFKCDDDICINIKHINCFLKIINNNNNINYCGRKIIRTKEYNEYAKNNNFDKYPTFVCNYAGGPLYYLSKTSMNCFDEPNIIKNIYYEDMMVGYHLNQFNISVESNYNLYSDNITDSNKISYHNTKKHQDLYIVIQGGLGNQLFQIATAIHFAKIHNKTFKFNINCIIPSPHQQRNIDITTNTIQKLFPNIEFTNTTPFDNEFYLYKEDKNKCFTFDDDNINLCMNTYNNIILHGYFIHYKYIPMDIFSNIVITPSDSTLMNMDFSNLYFIHIRLGDFLKTKMYQINLVNYYNKCIETILKTNKDAKFIVCTNQYDSLLYNYLNNFTTKIKLLIQDQNNNDIDTLFIMSSCCGGICSNSTLSFMGSVFQKNKNKNNNFMPYPFVDFIDGFNTTNVTLDMYPDWCSIYNTINDTFM